MLLAMLAVQDALSIPEIRYTHDREEGG